jgi:hypothetical protein
MARGRCRLSFSAAYRLPDEWATAVAFGTVEVSECSVFKVHLHKEAFTYKKPLKTENLSVFLRLYNFRP